LQALRMRTERGACHSEDLSELRVHSKKGRTSSWPPVPARNRWKSVGLNKGAPRPGGKKDGPRGSLTEQRGAAVPEYPAALRALGGAVPRWDCTPLWYVPMPGRREIIVSETVGVPASTLRAVPLRNSPKIVGGWECCSESGLHFFPRSRRSHGSLWQTRCPGGSCTASIR